MSDARSSPHDDSIIEQLSLALDLHEPLPERLSDIVAEAAFRLHRADDVIAELTVDTAFEEISTAGIRGEDGGRTITHSAAGRTIELRLGLEPDTATGRVNPSEGVELLLETRTETRRVQLESGRFRIVGLPPQFRLAVVDEDPTSSVPSRVVTEWISA